MVTSYLLPDGTVVSDPRRMLGVTLCAVSFSDSETNLNRWNVVCSLGTNHKSTDFVSATDVVTGLDHRQAMAVMKTILSVYNRATEKE